jgi:hypothetical protein
MNVMKEKIQKTGFILIVVFLLAPLAANAEIGLILGTDTGRGYYSNNLMGFCARVDTDIGDSLFFSVIKYSILTVGRASPHDFMQTWKLGAGYKFMGYNDYEYAFYTGASYDNGHLDDYTNPRVEISCLRPFAGISGGMKIFDSDTWLLMQAEYVFGDMHVDPNNLAVSLGLEYYPPAFSTHRRPGNFGTIGSSPKKYPFIYMDAKLCADMLVRFFLDDSVKQNFIEKYSYKIRAFARDNASQAEKYGILVDYAVTLNGIVEAYDSLFSMEKIGKNQWHLEEVSKKMVKREKY